MWMHVCVRACVSSNNGIRATFFYSSSLVDTLKSFINETDQAKTDSARPSMKDPSSPMCHFNKVTEKNTDHNVHRNNACREVIMGLLRHRPFIQLSSY